MDKQRVLLLATRLTMSATWIAKAIKDNDRSLAKEALASAEKDLAEIRQIFEELPPDPANEHPFH